MNFDDRSSADDQPDHSDPDNSDPDNSDPGNGELSYLQPGLTEIDGLLRQAVVDTRPMIDQRPIPQFRARTEPGRGLLAAAAALLLVVGAGGLLLTQRNSESPAPALTTVDDGESDDSSPAPDPQAPETARERHPGLDPDAAVASNDPDSLVADASPATETPLAIPDPYRAATDPAFGTQIMRVTNAVDGEFIVPMASQAWNADESLVLLYRTTDTGDGGHWLFDGQTFRFLRELDIAPSDIEHLYWSGSDPATLFIFEENRLIAYNVTTEERETIETFDGCDRVTSGNGMAPPSLDDQVFTLLCESGSQTSTMSLMRDAGGAQTFTAPAVGDLAPMPTPSGRFLIDVDETGQARVLGPDLKPTGITFEAELSTIAIATLDDGTEVAVTTIFSSDDEAMGNGTAIAHNLETGESTTAVGEDTGYPYPPSGNRMTAAAGSQYVAIGIQGDPDSLEGVLDGEVIVAEMTALTRPRILRLAHHRNQDRNQPWSDPFVSVSPSGERVIFASDWGTDHVDTYLVNLERGTG